MSKRKHMQVVGCFKAVFRRLGLAGWIYQPGFAQMIALSSFHSQQFALLLFFLFPARWVVFHVVFMTD